MSARDTALEAKLLASVERQVERKLGLRAEGFAAAVRHRLSVGEDDLPPIEVAPVTGGLPTYLDCLFGAEPLGSLAELRWRLRSGGMGREFVPLGERGRLAAMILARGRATDLYIGVAPRVRQEGGRDAIERGHVLYVDCDTPEAIKALEGFDPPPSLVVRSGRGVHGYFSIWPALAPDWLERANRRLALALGADMRATDAARILRPPGTFNHKAGEPVPVELEHVDAKAVYTAREVVDRLPDPPGRERPAPRVRSVELDPGDPLRAIPPPAYVEALTGHAVGRDGKIACPFHDDTSPSLHVFEEAERGWYCFGCEQGGDVFTFAGLLWGLEPRGSGYTAIRARLEADELLPALRRAA